MRRLRQYKLKERYALLFLAMGCPFLALAVWPNGVDYVGRFLDIDYRTVTLLCVSAFLILVVFQLLTIVSIQDQKITTLAQLVGILMEKQGHIDRERTGNAPPSPGRGDETVARAASRG